MPRYWETIQDAATLQQGDFLRDCYVAIPPITIEDQNKSECAVNIFDLIVITQTCDLVASRNKTDWVLLCPVFSHESLEELDEKYKKKDKWREIVQNKQKGFFWLPHWDAEDSIDGGFVVYYRQPFCLHIDYVRQKAVQQDGQRRRIGYPYLHGLAHMFGELFIRPALPEPWNQKSS